MARERPIDMIPPIWLCARRCMNQKKATKMATGMRKGRMLLRKPGVGVLYLTSTPCSSSAALSASGRPPSSGPVVRNSLPSSSLPLIDPLVLSTSISSTLPACTWVMNSE